jgi:hypothetical protein
MNGRLLVLGLGVAIAASTTLIASSVGGPVGVTLNVTERTPDADLTQARVRALVAARELNAARRNGHQHPAPKRIRSADASHAGALFATHSWYVAPPPPPPVAPPPPPPPQAPPFPYTFVGSYTPAGDTPVYFLARADRVIDAHVGDRLDGVYAFESAGSGGLVFNYLPLNIRQSVPIGASP